MEIRNAKMVVNKSGSGSSTFRATLPATWIREMGLSENVRDLKLTFDTEKIIIEKDMEEFNLKKENLMKKINGLIDEKILNTGKMGTEEVTVSLFLTDEEKEIFYDIEEYENENYWWEFNEEELYISYSEEIE